MIRLEALRAFVEVADHGNIKDASEKLYRTTSAVSMTLKQIEDRLGCALFETDRKSSLTDMGRFLHAQAVVLLRDYDRAMEQIEARSKARSGRLRVASVPSVATMLLPTFLQAFLQDRPDLEIDLVDTDSTDVRSLVGTGQVDFGIAGAGPDTPGLAFEAIFRDPFKVICRSDSQLAARGDVLDWADLKGLPLIANEATRALPSEEFQDLAAAARFSVRNVASLLAMVSTGMGVTLLPALATVNLPASLASRPLRDPACVRTVGIHWRGGKVLSPVANQFKREFVAATRALAGSLGLSPLYLDSTGEDIPVTSRQISD